MLTDMVRMGRSCAYASWTLEAKRPRFVLYNTALSLYMTTYMLTCS